MARKPSQEPTEAELEILHILWDQRAASLSQICDALRAQRPVATTTVATVLKVMREKEFVSREQTKQGPVWKARLTRRRTTTSFIRRLTDRLFEGSAQRLVAHVVESGQLSDAECKELERILKSRRQQNSTD